ncbi:hypothetical protein NDU88_007798 [Pleurodeles waltl]|uniref:Uncharacterized protein n=1 Tax=Pleurodeles waltl TaxID=8319 RepID=A0AAV7N7C9_PLEWA|nr:hypothetical protein NDU88_007798 [Pleurodeles waltl]
MAGGAREAPVPRASRLEEEGERPRSTDAALSLPAGRPGLRRTRGGSRSQGRGGAVGTRQAAEVVRYSPPPASRGGGEAQSLAWGCQLTEAAAQSAAVGLGAIFLGPRVCRGAIVYSPRSTHWPLVSRRWSSALDIHQWFGGLSAPPRHRRPRPAARRPAELSS